MKRHSFYLLSLCLGLFLMTGCHGGGSDDATTPDEPIPTDLPFTATAGLGAVVDPLKGLTITFSTPMDPASVEANLLLAQGAASESVADASVNISASDLTFHWNAANAANDTVTLFGPFPYCDAFEVTIGAETANAAGAVAGEPQVIGFTTRENPGDFDGEDCQADLGFYAKSSSVILLGEEIETVFRPQFAGSGTAISLKDLAQEKDRWVYDNLPLLVRADNVTAEGRAVFISGGEVEGESIGIVWQGYAQTHNAPYTGSILFDSKAEPRPEVVWSVPDLNGDGFDEIGISQDYSLMIGDDTLYALRDSVIFGGEKIRLASELVDIRDADIRHYQYSKGVRFEVGDLDGNGEADLVYFFTDILDDGLNCRYFIDFNPVFPGAVHNFIADTRAANYQFNQEHEAIVSSQCQAGQPVLWDGAVGDFNGDGIDDIAALARERDPYTALFSVNIYFLFGVEGERGNRTLTMAPMSKVATGFGIPDSISAMARDLNADGYADLVLFDRNRGTLIIAQGQKEWASEYRRGEFQTIAFSPGADYDLLKGVSFAGDVDNNGYQDLLVQASDIMGDTYQLLFLGKDLARNAKLTGDQADVAFREQPSEVW